MLQHVASFDSAEAEAQTDVAGHVGGRLLEAADYLFFDAIMAERGVIQPRRPAEAE